MTILKDYLEYGHPCVHQYMALVMYDRHLGFLSPLCIHED